MRRTLFALIVSIGFGMARGTDSVVLIAGPTSGFPLIGDHPAVTATKDGFAVAWRDVQLGGPYGFIGHLHFARYDAAGTRIVDSGPLEFDIDRTYLYLHELVPARGGFLSVMGDDAVAVWTLKIGTDGSQLGPAQQAVTAEEIETMSVAAANGKIVVTTPEWAGTWTDWATPIGDDGLPSGPRMNVEPARSDQNLEYRFLVDSPIAANGSGFATAWFEGGVGVRLRDLNGRGEPVGAVALVEDSDCFGFPGVAVVGGIEAVVYPRGCTQGDLYLRTRSRDGSLSSAIQISSDPQDEGVWNPDYFARSLRVIGADDRIGVLYSLVVPLPGGGTTIGWIFAEFDLQGRLIGRRRSLATDLLIDPDSDVDLQWDAYHGSFLLAWGGGGPQGRGVYVMSLSPSR